MQKATSQILADLMNNLQRFFKIGIYYPSGHASADQAAGAFLHSLNVIAGKDDTYIRFAVTETDLTVQGLELDHTLTSVQHFHDLLHLLSISPIDIHRDITNDELRQLLSKLVKLRTIIQNSSEFHGIQITDLPSTVKVHQLKFLASQSSSESEGSGDSSQPTIDYLLSSLVQQGLKDEQVSMCRDMLESIPDALNKRQVAESDLPSVTWDDVERLLRSVAESFDASDKETKEPIPEQHHNIDALVAILKSLGGTTGGTKSREAVNLLVKMAKGTPPKAKEETKEKPKTRDGNRPPRVTVDELRRILPAFKRESLPVNLMENNRAEELSIFMQMLGQEYGLHTTMKLHEAIRDCLRAPLEENEWNIVVQGMQDLIKHLDEEPITEVFLLLMSILQRSEHTNPLIFLRDVIKGITKEEFVSAWPFFINETFLAGPPHEPNLYKEMCTMSANISLHDIHGSISKLERLEALHEKRISPAIFSPPPRCLNPLFILLLNSSKAKYIYDQLITGLRRHPLGWLDKAVAHLLDSTLPSHQQFIVDLLKQKDPNNPDRNLRKIGAGIVVECLPKIPEEQREAVWVPNAIMVLGKTQVPGGKDLLDTIFTSRHYLLFPAWPGAARSAAGSALSKLY